MTVRRSVSFVCRDCSGHSVCRSDHSTPFRSGEPSDCRAETEELQRHRRRPRGHDESSLSVGGVLGGKTIEQPIKGSKLPNVICTLPGQTDSVILVGANFDHAEVGDGVIDNWSGASMLPSLYQALNIEPRRGAQRNGSCVESPVDGSKHRLDCRVP
jgi:hypothetical protein